MRVSASTSGSPPGARAAPPGRAPPPWGPAPPAPPRLNILHEDDAIVVVDKPVGLIVEPLPDASEHEPTVFDLLVDHYRHLPRARVYVVHRIDRDTSGLVLFARGGAARDRLKGQFEQRTPERVYQAVAVGLM